MVRAEERLRFGGSIRPIQPILIGICLSMIASYLVYFPTCGSMIDYLRRFPRS